MLVDGIRHSQLSRDGDHVGRFYSWMMATAGVMGHEKEDITDALVVGNCLGITATTLTKVDGLNVDAYEINQTIREVINDFPAGTLNIATNPQVNIIWQDGRSGLALNDKKYDLIITAPLHLRQAGSSTLLSQEYFKLIKRRLKPGGIVVMYSYERLPEQHQLIRQTVENEFKYSATWLACTLTVASDSPLDYNRETMKRRMKRSSPLYREIEQHHEERKQLGCLDLLKFVDPPTGKVSAGGYAITDDHPLIEYPLAANALVEVDAAITGARRNP